ncbi:hypothetical protein GQ53DRAFT_18970 [Thozetella sp. PMI_491]|nr:hypothetical protein GQ53DRAFT_18970 [Thozetella sp. PMI_491]
MAPTAHSLPPCGTCSNPPLLAIPYEVRDVIYAFFLGDPGAGHRELHLSREAGRFRLSGCGGAEQEIDRDNPRGLPGEYHNTWTVRAYRLKSSWGLHWKCGEDMMLSVKQGGSVHYPVSKILPIFLVCKELLVSQSSD